MKALTGARAAGRTALGRIGGCAWYLCRLASPASAWEFGPVARHPHSLGRAPSRMPPLPQIVLSWRPAQTQPATCHSRNSMPAPTMTADLEMCR